MPFPQKRFTSLSKNFIASYDFTDTIAGLGYINYYGIYDGTNSDLIRQPIASQVPYFQITTTGASYTSLSEKDWDLYFNTPQIVGGTLYVSLSAETHLAGSAFGFIRMDVTVYHYDGTTETQIGTATGTGAQWGNATDGSYRLLTPVDVSTTKFKEGDYLRVTIDLQGYDTGTTYTWNIWVDGAARGSTTHNQINPTSPVSTLSFTNTTDLKVLVPFKLYL
jgi:hypothetical protein